MLVSPLLETVTANSAGPKAVRVRLRPSDSWAFDRPQAASLVVWVERGRRDGDVPHPFIAETRA